MNGSLIGFINDVQRDGETMELGYALHPDYHNRGYMTAAFGAVMDMLFERGYLTVSAGAFEENKASIRVMEKCGMRRVPRMQSVKYRGEFHNCVYYIAANPDDGVWGDTTSYGGLMG